MRYNHERVAIPSKSIQWLLMECISSRSIVNPRLNCHSKPDAPAQDSNCCRCDIGESRHPTELAVEKVRVQDARHDER